MTRRRAWDCGSVAWMRQGNGRPWKWLSVGGHAEIRCVSIVLCFFALLAASALAQGPDPPVYVSVNIEGHTAPVRDIAFSPDSSLFFTAGMDKVVQVWSLNAVHAGARPTLRRESTLRREIARGLGGIIYSIAGHPRKNELVVGGYGARRRGDLTWFNPRTEQFLTTRYDDHLSPITRLAFSRTGRWFASMDKTGHALLWSDRRQAPKRIDQGGGTEGPEPEHRPIAIVGDAVVVMPIRAGIGDWRLQTYDINQGRYGQLDQKHVGHVTALATSGDGRSFASADQAGRIFVWQFGHPSPVKSLNAGLPVISLALDPSGQRLAAGTSLSPSDGQAEMQLWDLQAATVLRRSKQTNNVYGCAISPDGRYVAYGGGASHEVFVEDIENRWNPVASPGGTRIEQVRFHRAPKEHGFCFQIDSIGSGKRWMRLDLSQRELEIRASEAPTTEHSVFLGAWSYVADPTENRLWLYQNQQFRGYVQLDAETQGNLQCQCWIPGPGGGPIAVAVGTDIHNQVYVYGLPSNGQAAPMLRYFRGHHALVRSVDASPKDRWLASGAHDGTVSFWDLRGLSDPPVKRRWGVELRNEGGRLMVKSIDKLGPLYVKGVRVDEEIQKIMWAVPGHDPGLAQGAANILRALETLPWDTTVYFWTRQLKNVIALRGAWHRALGLFVNDAEWIAWTPAGYYDCSPGGERMLGWIVNQPQQLPEGAEGKKPTFFVAEQLNQKLFRPDILRELLKAGNLPRAPDNPGVPDRVENPGQLLPPKVEIVQPHDRDILLDHPQVKVRARATAVGKRRVSGMRLQIDGKDWQGGIRGTMKNVDLAPPPEVARDTGKEMTWVIDNLMPGKSEIKVFAETNDGLIGESDPLFVTYKTNQRRPSPTLYAFCVGISDYEHSPLKYAHLDAKKIADVLKVESRKVFDNPPQIRVLLEKQAKKRAILDGLEWLLDSMEQQDVGVFFFSGHGKSIEKNGCERTRYLVPADFNPRDVEGTCVSGEEFRKTCRSRDRKGDLIVLLDACHSGGIYLDDLVRIFKREAFGLFTFASSQGDEKSWELDELKAGVFAHYLVEGLKGAADHPQDADTEVVIGELGDYVTRRVQELRDQHPSFDFPVYDLPLTKK